MSNPVLTKYNTKIWYNSKKEFHRLEGPAIEWADGTQEWYVEGQRHRLYGPAIEGSSGSKEWFINGKRHRLEGPAIDLVSGLKEWWIAGVKLTEQDYPQAVLLYKCKLVLES